MVDRLPTNQTGRINEPSTTQRSSEKTSSTSESGPAFKALLDKLQQQAKTLQQDSETLEKAEDLSGAVDRARTSLGDALSLSDKLLEAYREAVHQEGPADVDPNKAPKGDAPR